MEKLTFYEKRRIASKRKNHGVDCGVLDRGLYYLAAIVLRDIEISGYIIINKQRRDFLDQIYELSPDITLYKYLLRKIIETYTTIKKWKKWVRAFLAEYQNYMDLITTEETRHASNILKYQNGLITGIQICDADEEYVDIAQLNMAFDIKEMIEAVEIVLSSMEASGFSFNTREEERSDDS